MRTYQVKMNYDRSELRICGKSPKAITLALREKQKAKYQSLFFDRTHWGEVHFCVYDIQS